MAMNAAQAAFLAMRGVTGPLEVFEGNKGLMDAISGPFEIDWSQEDLEAVRRTSVKKYNAEFHSQSVLEGVLELRAAHQIRGQEVERIQIDIFDVAYHIIGGGEEGDKCQVRTKEEADHSLPYMIAVALLDGEVTPAQYAPERITQEDAQELLRKVDIRPDEEMSRRFPAEMPCRIRIELKDGRLFEAEKQDFAGFFTRPISWEQAVAKCVRLAAPFAGAGQLNAIIAAVDHLEEIDITDLTGLLGVEFQGSSDLEHPGYEVVRKLS
jgi:2-methylcitrate dehydratase